MHIETQNDVSAAWKLKKLKPTWLTDKPVLANVPVFDFYELLKKVKSSKKRVISRAGLGHYGLVFRIQESHKATEIDITVKLMLYGLELPFLVKEILKFYCQSPQQPSKNAIANKLFEYRESHKVRDLVLRQCAGHVLGNLVYPNLIDAPVAIWAKKGSHNNLVPVAYSLPFVEGEAYAIASKPVILTTASMIQTQHNLYLGNPSTDSKNVVVSSEDPLIVKFIDVQIRDSSNYSFP